MAYIAAGQAETLDEITEGEFHAQSLAIRKRELAIEEARWEHEKKGDFWGDLAKVATVAVPLLTFFGVKEYMAMRRRRKK